MARSINNNLNYSSVLTLRQIATVVSRLSSKQDTILLHAELDKKSYQYDYLQYVNVDTGIAKLGWPSYVLLVDTRG